MKLCVIGVGRFGYQVATTLTDNGMEVMAIDSNEERIASIKDKVSQAICINVTDEEALRTIGIDEMDVVIVAMGEDFAQSVLITALLKQNFSVPRIITRTINKLHKDILLLIGADQVILPEQEMGIRLADMLSLPFNALMRVTPDVSLSYHRTPKELIGKPAEAMHSLYGTVCIGKKQKESIEIISPQYIIKANDILVYAGENQKLERVSKGS